MSWVEMGAIVANWINGRLAVSGQKTDVEAFAKVALTLPTFEELHALADPSPGVKCDEPQMDIDGPEKWRDGRWKIQYHFMAKYDVPLEEVTEASVNHPRLCFILGYCDPNDNTFGSYFIYKGQVEEFALPEDRVNDYVFDESGEDDESFMGYEPMDEVVDYWDEKIALTLRLEMLI